MNSKNMGWNIENSYLDLPEFFYSQVLPNPVSSPELIIINEPLVKSLGLDIDVLKSNEGLDILSGNSNQKDHKFLAMGYAGHQFGNFTMLGDGRAMLIGEQITPKGERFDIQLKGSGKTPYSRGGDGRAAIGPMLREYVISEAMYSLGIPTTRSLSVAATGDNIFRGTSLPGAILTRVSKSHIRVGTFEYAAKFGKIEDIKALADYTIKRHFPDIAGDKNPYLSLLKNVIKSQASLISKWQKIGFIHGVMNTDNMAISGETIDYGPCAFMDVYDPETVFSSIDRYGRYSYKNQPIIGAWNLARFAESLLPLLNSDQESAVSLAEDAVNSFNDLYYSNWIKEMRSKMGIFNKEVEDISLVEELLDLMKRYKADFTNTFVSLTFDRLDDSEIYKCEEFKNWNKKWNDRLSRQSQSKEESKILMKKSNPIIIPRNHLVEKALQVAENQKDYRELYALLKVLSNPYDDSNIDSKYSQAADISSTPYVTYCGT